MSTQHPTSVDNVRFIRRAALWCIAGGVIATTGAIVTGILPSFVPLTDASAPYTPAVFRFTQVIWAIAYALILLGIVGLARSNVTGASWLGRIGLWIAIVGKAALVMGNLGFAFIATATVTDAAYVFLDTVMGVASMVTAIGLVLAGIAVLRVGRWQGWQRFTPLLCGLFVFVVLLPILTLLPELFHWPVAAWSACFVLLGIALYQRASVSADSSEDVSGLDRRMAVSSVGVRSTTGL